jgi:hypothetical protein
VIHRNLVFRDEYQAKAVTFELTPGYALHVPSLAPHWVKNGDDVSISFSAGFVTQGYERRDGVHQVNALLRRWGLRPRPVGRTRWRDGLKFTAFRAWRRARRLRTVRGRQ